MECMYFIFYFLLTGKRIKLDGKEDLNIHWAPKGSYRLDTMLKTIANLPDRSNRNFFNKESGFALYILDDYAVHLMDDVRKAFLAKGYFLIIIGKSFSSS